MLLRDATTKAISLLCNVTGRCWWRVYHHAVLQLPQPPRPLRDWIVVYVLHRNSIYFLLSFWSDATKKIIFFSFLHAFRFISLTMIKITDTLMKKGLTRSLMWGHLAHLFVGCSSRTSVSFFGSFWGRRSYDSFISSSKSRGEHETRVKKGFGLREKLGKVLLFWFSINLSHFLSIFPNPLRSSNNGNTPPAVLMYLTSRSSCRSIKSISGIWVVWRRLRRLRRKWSQSVFFQRRSFEKNLTGQNGEV